MTKEEIKWISVKEKLPTDDEAMCVFIEVHNNCIISSYAGLFREIKIWRAFDLKHTYTHWMYLPSSFNTPDDTVRVNQTTHK